MIGTWTGIHVEFEVDLTDDLVKLEVLLLALGTAIMKRFATAAFERCGLRAYSA